MKLQLAAWALRGVRAAERIRWPRIEVRDVVMILLIGASLVFIANYKNSSTAAQQRQGRLIELRLCTTLDRLTELRPPPGNPAANPSRAFDQKLHATLGQLGPDLGCR